MAQSQENYVPKFYLIICFEARVIPASLMNSVLWLHVLQNYLNLQIAVTSHLNLNFMPLMKDFLPRKPWSGQRVREPSGRDCPCDHLNCGFGSPFGQKGLEQLEKIILLPRPPHTPLSSQSFKPLWTSQWRRQELNSGCKPLVIRCKEPLSR